MNGKSEKDAQEHRMWCTYENSFKKENQTHTLAHKHQAEKHLSMHTTQSIRIIIVFIIGNIAKKQKKARSNWWWNIYLYSA